MFLAIFLGYGIDAHSDTIKVAVASNFSAAIKSISAEFENATNHKVLLAFGSTGKHYAQIKNGAPFDIYFAADKDTPARLERDHVTQPNTRFTYALGKIVLWSPDMSATNIKESLFNLKNMNGKIAIANRRLSPYGLAASQVLSNLDVSDLLSHKLVTAENISQTFQWVHSGNADLGFVAYSQVLNPNLDVQGSYWIPPQSLYDLIEQQAVLLKDNQVARDFISFVKGPASREIIQLYGYDIPCY